LAEVWGGKSSLKIRTHEQVLIFYNFHGEATNELIILQSNCFGNSPKSLLLLAFPRQIRQGKKFLPGPTKSGPERGEGEGARYQITGIIPIINI